ncbi:MAG: hypothetical protein K2W92_02800 [Alphaproteobacteria bacterium]|nr:hypothetical protein [Alphaproteobacteria bacterium]
MSTWLEKRKEYQEKKNYMDMKFSEWSSVNKSFLDIEKQMMRHLKLGTIKIKFYDKINKVVVDGICISQPFIIQAVIVEDNSRCAKKELRNNEVSKYVIGKLKNTKRANVLDRSTTESINNIRKYFKALKNEESIQEFEYFVNEYSNYKIKNEEFYTKYEEKFQSVFGKQPSINHRLIDLFDQYGKWDIDHDFLICKIFSDTIEWNYRTKTIYKNGLDLSFNLPSEEEDIEDYLREHNENLDWFKYGVLPKVAVDYSVLACVNLETLSTSHWVELFKTNSIIPLSLIPMNKWISFGVEDILDIAKEKPEAIMYFEREDLYDIKSHGTSISIDNIYQSLSYEKQVNPDYYMNLSNEEMIHKDIKNLKNVPSYMSHANGSKSDDEDIDFGFGGRLSSRYSSDDVFLYERLSKEAKIENAHHVLWECPEKVSVEIINEALKRNSNLKQSIAMSFIRSPETYYRCIDEVNDITLEDYLKAWANDKAKSETSASIYVPLKNKEHVKDFMLESGCELIEKNTPLKFNPREVFVHPSYVIYKRKGKAYLQPRNTHSWDWNEGANFVAEDFMIEINKNNVCYEDYRDEVFEIYREKIVKEFIDSAKNHNTHLTKGSISKLKSLMPEYVIKDYLFKKGIIEFKFTNDVLVCGLDNVKAFDKAKNFINLSKKLVQKNDAVKIKKLKI